MSEARDAGAPDGVDELIVRSGQGGRDRKFHVPANPDDPDDTETLCHRANRKSSLFRKPVEVYPEGWFEWCEQCLTIYERGGTHDQ